MVEVAKKPAATDKSQESWDIHESESWSDHEKEVTGKLVASINSGNSIIFICLQQLYLAWKMSLRSYDKFTAEVQWMT